jgi:N-acetylmuramoyl-L-alanine amidase
LSGFIEKMGEILLRGKRIGFTGMLAFVGALPAVGQEHPVVCIDPGHPSEVNSGYTVQNGTTETHIDWVVAKKLEKLLREKGFSIVMTKESERQVVRNKDRALTANRAKAGLMVRLHCDSSPSHGFAIYYPDRTGTQQGTTGPSSDIRSRSRQAAVTMAAEMEKALSSALHSDGVKGDSKTFVGAKQGALTGSIFSTVPIITIEMVVLSNRADAAFIKTSEGQDKMAEAICNGIVRYLTPNGAAGGAQP